MLLINMLSMISVGSKADIYGTECRGGAYGTGVTVRSGAPDGSRSEPVRYTADLPHPDQNR